LAAKAGAGAGAVSVAAFESEELWLYSCLEGFG